MDRGLVNVLLNALIALFLTILGIAIFTFLWLRNDWYKLPDFEEGRYLKRLDTAENKFFKYIKRILGLLDEKHAILFIKRYGFEYYFYLHFHGRIALYFLLSFFGICLVIIIYSFFLPNSLYLAYTRITGIYSTDSKSHFLLNTLIMCTISMIMSIGLNSMTKAFKRTIALKAKLMQEKAVDIELNISASNREGNATDRSPTSSPRRSSQYDLHSPRSPRGKNIGNPSLKNIPEVQANKYESIGVVNEEEPEIDESDEYRFIMNTVLLYGVNPNDHNSDKLISYLKRLMIKNDIQATIVDYYSPKDLRDMANTMIAIEETRIYWHHVPWLKLTGKCM